MDNGLFPSAATTLVAGLDVGALAAAAICASQNLTQLLNTSVETVRISFHTAVTALSVSDTIEPSWGQDPLLTWSLSISDISVEKISAIISEFVSIEVSSYLVTCSICLMLSDFRLDLLHLNPMSVQ